MSSSEIYKQIKTDGIIAIVRGVDKNKIVDIAKALLEGGIKLMEVTCNTENAVEMVDMLSNQMQGKMTIGAGTVLTEQLCEQMSSAGAKYMVAPDVNPQLIEYCIDRDIPVLPGAATPTEVLTAARHGAKMVKIFPAAELGTNYIKMLKGPIDHIDFVAVGGVRANTIADFINAGCVAIGIGGSVINNDWIQTNNWSAMTDAARQYVKQMEKAKS
ncbi:MAG: bifunctional 4-hydroxy-2-oxoglutarate aldolase/2-dehydro-3-deoxy-phosphogluconate aldolase [Planctomycetes bacterium]|nr:bifunctional 4-hydroxy-2-oxoglutarate aldolase/2-dehydro-3-deoxy-phosphogluconate aldolase [Planctomycetota bacterium]